MELKDKKVLIVGLGKTGEALCRFLLRHGARVRVSDHKPEEALGGRPAYWRARGAEFETGGHRTSSFLGSDLIVLSPGVPPLAETAKAQERGIPIISELELAHAFLKGRIVGITGSNGKSTTTTLAQKILAEGGLRAFAAGNIGTPLISFADKSRDEDVYVTEISSFQLERIRNFKAGVTVFLNISGNHLDRHETFDNYFAAKKKLVLSQDESGVTVLNRDDALVWGLRTETKAAVYAFSRKRKAVRGAFLDGEWIVLRDGTDVRAAKISDVRLPGAHNLDNVMAAALIGRLFGVPGRSMRASIRDFRGLEHRLENVRTVKKVLFINDSKATTVDATIKALESFDRKIVLILGGKDKGGDFRLLREHLARKVRKVLLIGQAAEKIEAAVRDVVPVAKASTFKDLVRLGYEAAEPGDVVLLAPACTSWDMFRNFEERGKTFKREVERLARRIEGK